MIFDLTDGKINGKSKQIWEAFMDQETEIQFKYRKEDQEDHYKLLTKDFQNNPLG